MGNRMLSAIFRKYGPLVAAYSVFIVVRLEAESPPAQGIKDWLSPQKEMLLKIADGSSSSTGIREVAAYIDEILTNFSTAVHSQTTIPVLKDLQESLLFYTDDRTNFSDTTLDFVVPGKGVGVLPGPIVPSSGYLILHPIKSQEDSVALCKLFDMRVELRINRAIIKDITKGYSSALFAEKASVVSGVSVPRIELIYNKVGAGLGIMTLRGVVSQLSKEDINAMCVFSDTYPMSIDELSQDEAVLVDSQLRSRLTADFARVNGGLKELFGIHDVSPSAYHDIVAGACRALKKKLLEVSVSVAAQKRLTIEQVKLLEDVANVPLTELKDPVVDTTKKVVALGDDVPSDECCARMLVRYVQSFNPEFLGSPVKVSRNASLSNEAWSAVIPVLSKYSNQNIGLDSTMLALRDQALGILAKIKGH